MQRINEKFWYDPDARVVRICNEYIGLAKTHTEGRNLAAELNNVMALWCNEPFRASTAIAKKLERVYPLGRTGDRHRPLAPGHNRKGEAGSCTKCAAIHSQGSV